MTDSAPVTAFSNVEQHRQATHLAYSGFRVVMGPDPPKIKIAENAAEGVAPTRTTNPLHFPERHTMTVHRGEGESKRHSGRQKDLVGCGGHSV